MDNINTQLLRQIIKKDFKKEDKTFFDIEIETAHNITFEIETKYFSKQKKYSGMVNEIIWEKNIESIVLKKKNQIVYQEKFSQELLGNNLEALFGVKLKDSLWSQLYCFNKSICFSSETKHFFSQLGDLTVVSFDLHSLLNKPIKINDKTIVLQSIIEIKEDSVSFDYI